jgi:folate-dependent phosphoribosylglycinamide formyltransferase PurN
MASFRDLDEQVAALKAKHPGWRIWFVPHSVDGGVTWCAVREPTINTDTPEHLSQEIELAEKDHAAGIVPER